MENKIVGKIKKKWPIYSIIIIFFIVVAYLFYYYIWQQVGVVVAFNPSVTEGVALRTLSKYKDGIELRAPKDYDRNFFNLLSDFKLNTIEFATCRFCGYAMKNHIAVESGVRKVAIIEHLPSWQEDKQFLDYLKLHPINP